MKGTAEFEVMNKDASACRQTAVDLACQVAGVEGLDLLASYSLVGGTLTVERAVHRGAGEVRVVTWAQPFAFTWETRGAS